VEPELGPGAWQYPIPEDASPQNVDWDRFLGSAPRVPFQPIRLFRWRNYRDYGTGMAGDLFVHLFSTLHVALDSLGPTRIMASGGLRHWHDGRDVPDVMVGMYDYPKTERHPEFNLTLKCNFADGATTSLWGESGFRFNGHEGVLLLDPGHVTVMRRPTGDPAGLRTAAQERFLPPQGYDDRLDHFKNFFAAMRGGPPTVEDAAFGLRAAAPAVLSNDSHFEQRFIAWDPVAHAGQAGLRRRHATDTSRHPGRGVHRRYPRRVVSPLRAGRGGRRRLRAHACPGRGVRRAAPRAALVHRPRRAHRRGRLRGRGRLPAERAAPSVTLAAARAPGVT
jgi:hypothetical protein